MSPEPKKEKLVKVFEAPTIYRGHGGAQPARSAGIFSPDFESAEPFALNDPPEGWHDAEVWVPESQAEEARKIIADARRTAQPAVRSGFR